MFNVILTSTQRWGVEEAIKELREKLSDSEPQLKIVFIFSTIHYANSIKEVLTTFSGFFSEKVPIVGGTVAGFMNNFGVFTRGIVMAAIYSDELHVAVGIGKNTKKDPIRAAANSVKEIEVLASNLGKDYNPFLFILTSGPIQPNFPLIGRKFVIRSGLLSYLAIRLMNFSTRFFQKGFGREEEVLGEIERRIPSAKIIGGSSCDSNNVISNFQFFNGEVYENSVVSVSLFTKSPILMKHAQGYIPVGKEFKVTKRTSDGRIISGLDGRPAIKEFLKAVGLREDDLNERLHRKTFFLPFGIKNDYGVYSPLAIGGILKDSFYFSYGMIGDRLNLLSSRGASILESTNNIFNGVDLDQTKFVLSIMCSSWLETLGKSNYLVYDLLKKYFSETPFLILYTLGEQFKEKDKPACQLNESFNFAVFE